MTDCLGIVPCELWQNAIFSFLDLLDLFVFSHVSQQTRKWVDEEARKRYRQDLERKYFLPYSDQKFDSSGACTGCTTYVNKKLTCYKKETKKMANKSLSKLLLQQGSWRRQKFFLPWIIATVPNPLIQWLSDYHIYKGLHAAYYRIYVGDFCDAMCIYFKDSIPTISALLERFRALGRSIDSQILSTELNHFMN